jgi:hypothetical protein
MKNFNELNATEKKTICEIVFESNLKEASLGLLGFAVRKLAPTKENLKKFQLQFSGHPLCSCFGCIELGKNFAMSNRDIKEEIISVSTDEVQSGKYHS